MKRSLIALTASILCIMQCMTLNVSADEVRIGKSGPDVITTTYEAVNFEFPDSFICYKQNEDRFISRDYEFVFIVDFNNDRKSFNLTVTYKGAELYNQDSIKFNSTVTIGNKDYYTSLQNDSIMFSLRPINITTTTTTTTVTTSVESTTSLTTGKDGSSPKTGDSLGSLMSIGLTSGAVLLAVGLTKRSKRCER